MPSPLIVIVGETASGKSAAGMDLARQFNGEIICADSRTVYKGMDIGTAKPSKQDRAEIPHHLLDIVEPNQPFTAADFKRLASKAIEDISSRGKLPIMVGGSGLYVDSVLFDYGFAPSQSSKRDVLNPRHLDPSVKVTKKDLRPDTLVVGLRLPNEILNNRIQNRVNQMVNEGFIDEVRHIASKYDRDINALRAPGYKAFLGYVDGVLDLDQAKEAFIKSDMILAKKQRTWFKRNKYIQWADDPSKIVALATTFLNT